MNRRSFIKRAGGLTASCLLAAPWQQTLAQQTPRTVVVGAFPLAPPFSYLEKGQFKGISNDILQRVAEKKGLTLKYNSLKFDALIPAVQAGQIDMAVSGIFVTEERKRVVDFSDPYHTQGTAIAVLIDSPIREVADLKGKVLACEQGSASMRVAQERAKEWGITLRVLPDVANMHLALRTGDVDALVYDSGILAYQISTEADKPTIRTVGQIISPTGIAFAFPKGSDLIPIINEGMAELQVSGELAAIKRKYQLD